MRKRYQAVALTHPTTEPIICSCTYLLPRHFVKFLCNLAQGEHIQHAEVFKLVIKTRVHVSKRRADYFAEIKDALILMRVTIIRVLYACIDAFASMPCPSSAQTTTVRSIHQSMYEGICSPR